MYERASVSVTAWASNMRSPFLSQSTLDAAPPRRAGRSGARRMGRTAWKPGLVGRSEPTRDGPRAVLDAKAGGHVLQDERDEIGVAVLDQLFRGRHAWVLPGPGRDPGGPIAVEFGAAGRDPLAQPVAGIGEVAVPRQRRRRRAVWVVGVEPVRVQGRQFPDQFVVAVPERRDYGRREPVRRAQPVDPGRWGQA